MLKLTQCSKASCLHPASLAALTASLISSASAIPVDIIRGLLVLAAYLIKDRSMASNDAIL